MGRGAVRRAAMAHGVGYEVDEDLRQPVAVGRHDMALRRLVALDDRAALLPQALGRGQRALDHIAERDRRKIEANAPVLQKAEVQNVVQKPRQADAFRMDDPGELGLAFGVHPLRIPKDLGERADRRHRRAQFVADLAEEHVLLGAQFRQFAIGRAQLLSRFDQLARFAFQLGGILHDLRGLVGHRDHRLKADRLARGDLPDHRMGGRGADRAGEFPLQP